MRYFSIIVILLISFFSLSGVAYAEKPDRLAEIEKARVIRIAVFDSNPPFGYIDPKSKKLVGYDIDIAEAIGKALNVEVMLRPTNPANRIPLLRSKKVDLIIANFTITDERAREVNFSVPYFSSRTEFIARKGVLKKPEDIGKLRIGADKGTVQEIRLREYYPTAKVISYDDTPLAFSALRNGNVQAITQDDSKLIGLLGSITEEQRSDFEISSFNIMEEYQGVGIPKDEKRLTKKINDILVDLEKSGKAKEIYDGWFGPQTPFSRPRNDFKFGSLTKHSTN
jgi:polar amino acid transport system substrate-binding protein